MVVFVKKFVMLDYIICLEDGKKFKLFKCYLWIYYNMMLEEYCDKWDLLVDYLMVVLNYVVVWFELVKKMGLG